ncbi:Golgi apyrase [Gaertneriomyces sp. JEL0708]|nr:Golgi apyrase [Gaertneriomyces sp. JEL0708]
MQARNGWKDKLGRGCKMTLAMCGGRKITRLAWILASLTTIILFSTFIRRYLTATRLARENTSPSSPDNAILTLQTSFPLPPLDLPAPPSWDYNRQYGIVVDAGSSGSRVQIYSWVNPMYSQHLAEGNREWDSLGGKLPLIQTADEKSENWQMKQEPGISTFGEYPSRIGEHLKPLLDYAMKVIPSKKHKYTPVYLLATAGMRLLPASTASEILSTACQFVRDNYLFATTNGCNLHFQVISGELEGIYGWLTVNYLKNGFKADPSSNHTFGFLDMGGASTQIAFEPTKEMKDQHADDLTPLKLRYLDGFEQDYHVFVTTFLGFGMNEARRRFVEGLLKESGTDSVPVTGPSAGEGNHNASDKIVVPDPCLPAGLELNVTTSDTAWVALNGTGTFDSCVTSLQPLLNKSLPCPEAPCLFNGVHAPTSPSLSYLGVSEYWYTSSEVYGLGGTYNSSLFLSTSRQFCAQSWPEISSLYESGKFPQVSGLERLRLQCFKSAWLMSVLHDGLGIPREDVRVPGDDDDAGSGIDVGGSGSTMESVDKIAGMGVSWTLGSMLLHVAATIPNGARVTPGRLSVMPLVVVMVVVVGVAGWRWRRMRNASQGSGSRGYVGLNQNQEMTEGDRIDIILSDLDEADAAQRTSSDHPASRASEMDGPWGDHLQVR